MQKCLADVAKFNILKGELSSILADCTSRLMDRCTCNFHTSTCITALGRSYMEGRKDKVCVTPFYYIQSCDLQIHEK